MSSCAAATVNRSQTFLWSASNINVWRMLMFQNRGAIGEALCWNACSCFGSRPPLWKPVIITADKPAVCKGEGGKLGDRETEGQMQWLHNSLPVAYTVCASGRKNTLFMNSLEWPGLVHIIMKRDIVIIFLMSFDQFNQCLNWLISGGNSRCTLMMKTQMMQMHYPTSPEPWLADSLLHITL